jgi:aminoglycoside phosphotransferase (APT) family kinase protein
VEAPVGQGREAEIRPWDGGRVVRLLRDPARGDNLDRERTVMEAARAAGVPVPAAHELVTVDGRPGLVMDRVAGDDVMTELGARPWRLLAVAGRLGSLQAELNAVPAPDQLPALHAVLTERIERAAGLSPTDRDAVTMRLAGLPEGDRICHGDFHPGNVLWGPEGPMIIDWTNAARGDPDADLARTMLLLEVGVIPGDLSAVARFADRVGRSWFARRWRRAYERARPVDDERVRAWYVVWAAGRLAEGIDEENPSLVAIVREGTR